MLPERRDIHDFLEKKLIFSNIIRSSDNIISLDRREWRMRNADMVFL